MKHATPATLQRLCGLLQPLREAGLLVERTPGAFYWKSKAFLHFHEDGDRVFADVKLDPGGFTRVEVSDKAGQARLLREILTRLRV